MDSILREQARAEGLLKLKSLNVDLWAVAESLNDGLGLADKDGIVLYVNSRLTEILGRSEEELIGKCAYDHYFEEGTPEHEAAAEKMAKRYQDRLQGKSEVYESYICRKDGERRWLETRGSPLKNRNGEVVGSIGALTDITERKNLEEQLRWSQKMEAVGRLAGGVAHDFNNLLTVIHGYAREIKVAVSSQDELLEQVETIIKASESAGTLTKQLLTISQRQVAQLTPICLSDLVHSSLAIIKGLTGDKIEILTSLDPNLPLTQADSSQIQQILMNLVVNARDAMPDKGTLIISTALVDAGNKVVIQPSRLEGKFVRLRVADTGQGIKEEIKNKIFEPFFTTKEGMNRGSGLGLSITFGIVKDHRGEILVSSNVNEGATFDVLLPVASVVHKSATVPELLGKQVKGTETILLAEDEDEIRRLFKKYLVCLGYKVIDVSNGAEGLEVLQTVADIDLLITDIVMPKIGGLELAKRLLESRPKLRIIAISGYPGEGDDMKKLRELGCDYLEKPLTPDMLAELVRTVLDRKNDFALQANA